MHTKEDTIAALKRFDTGEQFPGAAAPPPRASVLIPLLLKDGGLHALMTVRSEQLRTSAGEVCFPGGKRDPTDRDDVDTALREAEEEIGLPRDGVQVVCRLLPYVTKSGLSVTPVVGFIDESFSPTPNPAEVSAVFTVPLDSFTCGKDGAADAFQPWRSFNFVDPDTGRQYHIWGLTAFLAAIVAALTLQKPPWGEADPMDLQAFFKNIYQSRLSKL